MNILLIYPGLVEGFDSYDKRSNWFKLGIGIISSILKNDGPKVILQLHHGAKFEL
jgi:hypothetical protein